MLTAQVISLRRRTDRRQQFAAHAAEQGIPYTFVDAIATLPVHTAVTQSHKLVVRNAMAQGWPQVLIMEDDCWFPSADGFRWFLKQIPTKPFDLFLGGIYGGTADHHGRLQRFNGTHCYIVHSRYYRRFLHATEDQFIDNALSALGGTFYVCQPFAALQRPGFSDGKGAHTDHMHLVQGKYRV